MKMEGDVIFDLENDILVDCIEWGFLYNYEKEVGRYWRD